MLGKLGQIFTLPSDNGFQVIEVAETVHLKLWAVMPTADLIFHILI